MRFVRAAPFSSATMMPLAETLRGDYSFIQTGQRWISGGMKWWSQREQPTDWNPTAQLERLQHNAA
jgi:hypothetical protein